MRASFRHNVIDAAKSGIEEEEEEEDEVTDRCGEGFA